MKLLPPEELESRNIDFSESMKRGAESGDVQSMHLYANHCLRQYSIKGDIDSRKEAEYYLCKAAEAGLFHAQLDLATAYWFRFDEIRNKKEADYLISLHLMNLSEGKNFEDFDFKAAHATLPPRDDMTDYEKAFFWFSKAEEKGDCFAAMCIGWFYETGTGGVTKDKDTALSWYRKSAEDGYLPAQSIIGYWHTSGQLKSTHPNAEQWYQNIAKRSPYSVVLPSPLEAVYGTELKRIVQAGTTPDKNQSNSKHPKSMERKNV